MDWADHGVFYSGMCDERSETGGEEEAGEVEGEEDAGLGQEVEGLGSWGRGWSLDWVVEYAVSP